MRFTHIFFLPIFNNDTYFFNMHNHLSRSNWIIMASSASFSFPFTKKQKTCNLLTKTTIIPWIKVGNSTYIYLLRYNVHSLNFFSKENVVLSSKYRRRLIYFKRWKRKTCSFWTGCLIYWDTVLNLEILR